MPRPRHAAQYRRPQPRIRTARWLLVGLLTLTFGWLTAMNQLRVVGMGHVRTEEAIISSLFEGPITELHVTCNDRVAKGDLLAVVGHPIRDHSYRAELVQLESDHRLRRIVHEGRIAVAEARVRAAERQQAAMLRYSENANALAAMTGQAWQAHAVPMKDRIAALNARDRAVEGLAQAEASLRRHRAELERERTEAEAQLAGFDERVDAQRIRTGLGGNQEIRAPFDGTVTDCPRNVGDTARPSVAIVRMQRANSARIFIWVPAIELERITAGMRVDIVVADSGRTLEGRVLRLPIEVGGLPQSLKRYFWQNQTWQQYAEMEVAPVDPRDVANLPGDARVDAVVRLTTGWRLPRKLVESL